MFQFAGQKVLSFYFIACSGFGAVFHNPFPPPPPQKKKNSPLNLSQQNLQKISGIVGHSLSFASVCGGESWAGHDLLEGQQKIENHV